MKDRRRETWQNRRGNGYTVGITGSRGGSVLGSDQIQGVVVGSPKWRQVKGGPSAEEAKEPRGHSGTDTEPHV